ncbi:MAG: T9SS type A sorting domain-containing protein [Cytophagaceae bacterium]|nr:T9SS type A sorting domain-containing protein [Cytophagaceae bacterium]
MAQKEANVWWFGTKSGLDFNFSPPLYLDSKPINTYEGSSTICDPNTGALIFATDGQSVWYPNGTTVSGGTGLRGASSSAQSALIVPNPSNANQWFIFTSNVDPGTGTPYGTNYYTVNRAAGVLTVGAVTNLLGVSASTEQLCALGDGANGYWVITHGTDGSGVGVGAGSNAIHAFRVTSAGVVSTAPVTSNVGHAMKSYQGLMKTNSCQTQIAATYLSEATTEVYNFDNSTGTVTGLACSIGSLVQPYGLEFSPNDLYLYHATLGGTMYQLTVATCANANTSWAYPPNGSARFGQMQLGPDGRIYVSNECTGSSCYIGVISLPNNPFASAGWNSTAIASPTPNTLGYPQLGLPTFSRTFVSGILTASPASGTYCINTDIPLSYIFSGPVTSQTWTVTPATGWSFTSGTSTDPSPTIRFTTAGPYNVKLDVVSCSRTYTKNISFTIVNPKTPVGTVSCSAPYDLILDNPAVDADEPNYIWYAGSVASSNIIGIGTPVIYRVGNTASIPSTICLGVASSATPTVGSNSIASSLTLPGAANGVPYVSNNISVLSDQLVLKSFDLKFWVCPSPNYTVTIKNGGGTTVYAQTNTIASCVSGTVYTVIVNTTLKKGNNYTITIDGGGAQLYRNSWAAATNAGEITYGPEPSAGITSIANIQYDYKNFAVTTTCSTNPCYSVSCSLPVELVEFYGLSSDQGLKLFWNTASEINNSYFQIEHSLTGSDFTAIGKVSGAGNSNSLINYTFIDANASQGINYYRLAQYDFDGSVHYSKIIIVNQGIGSSDFTVSPNPSASNFTLHFNRDFSQANLLVTDIIGRNLFTQSLTSGNESITFGEYFPKGIYLVQLNDGKSTVVKRIVKE